MSIRYSAKFVFLPGCIVDLPAEPSVALVIIFPLLLLPFPMKCPVQIVAKFSIDRIVEQTCT